MLWRGALTLTATSQEEQACLTYDDGIVGDLFCVSSIIVKRQVPDSSVQVLDEPSLMHIHGADMSGASLRFFFERTG